ncbi:MAG: MATE family efflux transporter [Atopobiaceae bacterium]|nr:MATE family efflux transporter [Atopobiaceae bacterium]
MAARNTSQSLDVTKGVIWRQLAALFFPVLAGAVFQELYTLINAYIVGQYASLTALGAIQATATLTDLTISLTIGMGMGCSVIVSQYFGAGDDRRLEQAVHTAVALSLALGFAASIAGVMCAGPLLRLMGTPADLLGESLDFIYVYFGSALLPVVFNMGAALLRAVGNTRTPSRIIAFTCLVNIALDVVFVVRLGMGARGAALSTAGAYLVGTIMVICSLMRARGPWRLHPSKIRVNGSIARDMLKCAVPLAAQNAIFPLSNMVVQSTVNGFGSDTVVAWGLCGRIGSVAWLVSDAFAMSATTFSAQNFGAGDYRRMKRGLHVSLLMATIGMALVEAIICLNARELSWLFANDSSIVRLTSWLILITVPFYVIFSFMDIIAGVIRGAGESLMPMVIIGLGTCVLRLVWMLAVVPRYHSIVTVVVSYPFTWTITTIMFIFYYRHGGWLTRSLRTARHRRKEV